MNEKVEDLCALISDYEKRLDDIANSLEAALQNEIQTLGRTQISAMIVAGFAENYYTCLETVYLRISQFFENDLDPSRWHTDLLSKMRIQIEGVRIAVVSKENYSNLMELLKFRHLKRYYFDLEYDWDRLDFLLTKLRKAHPLVQRDTGNFLKFLQAI